jgi:hypothetical protein
MDDVVSLLASLAKQGIKLTAEDGRLACCARPGVVTQELAARIASNKQALLDLLRATDRTVVLPLSEGQQGLYFLHASDPQGASLNVPLCVELHGTLNVDHLARAWQATLGDHPLLTARIDDHDGELCFRTGNPAGMQIERIQESAAALEQRIERFVRQPFDLRGEPSSRAALFEAPGVTPLLVVVVHHIAFDGTSAMVLLRSLLQHYGQQGPNAGAVARPTRQSWAAFVDRSERFCRRPA